MGSIEMFTNRFSSSGLAGASVDAFSEKGVVARMVYRPRFLNDPTPFLVQIVEVSQPAEENSGDAGEVEHQKAAGF